MALVIEDPELDQKVHTVANALGKTVEETIRIALDRVEIPTPKTSPQHPKPTVEEILALVRSYNLQPINSDLTDDEILGYGPDGIPE